MVKLPQQDNETREQRRVRLKKASNARWYQKNKERIRDLKRLKPYDPAKQYLYRIKSMYGLTPEDREKMPKSCEICNSSGSLHIDHCHSSGVVRGILCKNCNIALGLIKDDVHIMSNMIKYMEKHLYENS